MVDVVLINPGNRRQVYQGLGEDYSAIEPPFWVAVLTTYLKNKGFEAVIIDANAENITPEETAHRVNALNPLLSAVIVYGSQPSASTQNMTIAGYICKAIKENTSSKVAIGGLHPSALPERTLKEESVDFVIDGEGAYTLEGLLKALKSAKADYSKVSGLWYYDGKIIKGNSRARIVRSLDDVFPVGAWDLLPMLKYRAHNWHCFDDIKNRTPYAAIYTSLGCPYSCVFCCINAPFGNPGIRYRDPKLVVDEIGSLVKKYGIKNLKIIDELFIFDEKHYMRIVDLLLERNYGLNIWAYARVDTVKFDNLSKMKKSGINWLALGIESANPDVRNGALKKMKAVNIKKVVRSIQAEGIRVMGNFIFGLPDDTLGSMQETFTMAQELNCEFVNFYCAMAYPGSRLYDIAVKDGWEIPNEWHGFSQHSFEMLPLPTRSLSAPEVLKFRDDAFHKYFSDSRYLEMVERKFGKGIKDHVVEMAKIKLKRRILEN